ncbi:MAG: ATP-binding protein [Lachnospiraceae bacterium]|nr:ATP-binding protein [Lachnospiraceae bacterium]
MIQNMKKKHQQNETDRRSYRKRLFMAVLPAAVFLILLGMAFEVWREYRDTLMENQEEQLLIVSRTLAKDMEISFLEYQDNLEFLALIEEQGDRETYFESFIRTQSSFVCDLFLEDENGEIMESTMGTELTNPVHISDAENEKSFWLYDDAGGNKFFVIRKVLENGKSLCLSIDAQAYYGELISGIHLGTNGYVMVKNSAGLILMHPEKNQWGIMVIEGRRQMYPDLDYSSLQKMVDEQIRGGEGISEYYSYWWTDEDLPRVKKISAYAQADVGTDFWVISAVIDYNDLYNPIRDGYRKIVMIFCVILTLAVLLAFWVGKLLVDSEKAAVEISYLKDLNALLEEVHRSEETIAHQQRLQIMGTMTGGIAHEFNNFLTPIMGYAELLMLGLPEDSEEYDEAREIYEASEKAKDVIRQISLLSRKNVETVYKSIPMAKTLSRAMKMVESVRPPQVHLETLIQLENECILGNTTQINQVLLNICVNAIHAIGRKEGLLQVHACCVERSALKEEITVEIPDTWSRYIRIDIEDNGCGMTQDTLRKIFDPFFTTKAGGEGTGLGLSLAEQIIVSHKGYIYAESEVGKGSIFHIYLPVLEQTALPETFSEQNGEEICILVADDNAKILELLKKNFARLDISILTCMNREELKKMLEKEKVDILVIDETLQDSNGIDFCMSIKGKYPGLLKLVMVDCVTREVADARKRSIIDAYVEKPVSETTILSAIRQCIARGNI